MEFANIEELLMTPADSYFEEYIAESCIRTKAINWIREISEESTYDRITMKRETKYKRILISDIIQFPIRDMLKFRNMGKLTVQAMNEALAVNGLSLDMHPYKLAALRKANNPDSDLDIVEKVCAKLNGLLKKHNDKELYIELGNNIIPGFECTLCINKI